MDTLLDHQSWFPLIDQPGCLVPHSLSCEPLRSGAVSPFSQSSFSTIGATTSAIPSFSESDLWAVDPMMTGNVNLSQSHSSLAISSVTVAHPELSQSHLLVTNPPFATDRMGFSSRDLSQQQSSARGPSMIIDPIAIPSRSLRALVIEPVIVAFHDFFEPEPGHNPWLNLVEPLLCHSESFGPLNGFSIEESFSQAASYDPFCGQIVYATVDFCGRRSFFRSTFYRLTSLRRRLLNLKEIGRRLVAFLDGFKAKKPFSPKKSYTPHHRITIDLTLVC